MNELILENLTESQKEIAVQVFEFSCCHGKNRELRHSHDCTLNTMVFRIEPPIEEGTNND